MNTSKVLCRLGAAVLVTCTVACAPARIPVKQSFWKETQHKVGVTAMPAPQLAAHRTGGQGLLDVAINNAMSGSLEAHLQTVDVNKFGTVADQFVEQLSARGISARKLDAPPDITKLRKFKTDASGEFAEKDLRPLAEKEQIDTLVILSISQCGTMRPYYGFIPLDAPSAMCVSTGQMIDLKTNQIAWRTSMEADKATVKVSGNWDQPPDYRNVTKAIDTSVAKAQDFLVKDFLQGAPRAQAKAPTASLERN